MSDSNHRYSRQSFLGKDSQGAIENTKIAVVGLGGGGSHIAQQLGHIGFLDYVLFDPQAIEQSNLNRMVGATQADVDAKELKVKISQKTVLSIQPTATVKAVNENWQKHPELLRDRDIIFGCVDSFKDRSELEASARRHLIPYVDLGMDVFQKGNEPPRMVGQVILSLPDDLCLRCLGFITEEKLALEASKYGVAGFRPQVVWPNGILASAAVGIAIDLITGWTKRENSLVYLSFDGNYLTLTPHVRLEHELPEICPHFPSNLVGEPRFKML